MLLHALMISIAPFACGLWAPILMRGKTHKQGLTWMLASAYAVCLGMTSLSAYAAQLVGGGLIVVRLALAAGGVSTVLCLRRLNFKPDRKSDIYADLAMISLACLLGITGLGVGNGLMSDSDASYHTSTIRSLIERDAALPTDPFFFSDNPPLDPTAGTWHTMIAAISPGADPADVWSAIMLSTLLTFIAAVHAISRSISSSAALCTAATMALALSLSAPTPLFLGLPRTFAILLALLSVSMLAIPLRDGRSPVWIAALVAIGAAGAHMSAALIVLLGWSTWLIVRCLSLTSSTSVRTELAIYAKPFAALVGGTAPYLLTRYLSTKATIVGGGTIGSGLASLETTERLSLGFTHILNPMHVLGGTLSAGLIGALTLAVIAITQYRSKTTAVFLSMAALAPIVAFNPLLTPLLDSFSTYSTDRLADATKWAAWVSVIAGAALIKNALDSMKEVRDLRSMTFVLASAVCLLSIVVTGVIGIRNITMSLSSSEPTGTSWTRAHHLNRIWGEDTPNAVRRIFNDEYPVIIGSPFTQYDVAGIAPIKPVATNESHTPLYFLGEDYVTRYNESFEFVLPSTTDIRRAEIAQRYGATYIVVDFIASRHTLDSPSYENVVQSAKQFRNSPGLYDLIYEVPGRFELYRIIK